MRPGSHRLILAGLVLAQWLAVGIFAATVEHNGWLWYQGGDETFYYTTAWLLQDGEFSRTGISYLWPYLTAPLAVGSNALILASLPAIVLFQVTVLLPVALLSIYGLVSRIGGRALGYGAAVLWILLPYLAIPLWVDRYHERYLEQVLPQALGLTAMADFPSMVALLASAYCCFRALDEAEPKWAALGGLATGLAVGIKPANLLFLVGPALAFILVRRARRFVVPFALALLPGLLALGAWKLRVLGEVPIAAYHEVRAAAGAPMALSVPLERYGGIDIERLRLNLDGLREFFWSERLVEWAPLAGLVAVARVSGAKALLLAGWLGAFLLVKGSSPQASVDTGSFFRLLQPAFPAFFVLVASIPLLVPTVGMRLRERLAAAAGGWNRHWHRFSIAALVLVVAQLVSMPLLREAAAGRSVEDKLSRVLVPVDAALVPNLVQRGHEIELAWSKIESRGAAVFYRVLRSEPTAIEDGNPDAPPAENGVRCATAIAGAPDCVLVMTTIGISRERRWVDRPPRGTWVYRIGLSANWADDVLLGDMLLLSPPVTVTVA